MQKLEAFQVGFGVGRIGRVELWRGTGKWRQGGRERRKMPEIHIGSYSLMYLKGFGGTLELVEEDGDGDGGYGEGVGGGGGVGVFLC